MSGDQTLRQLLHRVDIKRLTAAAYEATAPDSVALTFSRADEFFVQSVLIGFSDGTGTVTVQGLDLAGVTQSVVLTFTGNQRRMNNQQRFVSLFEVTSSGLTNESTVGTVQVIAVSRTGQPREEFTTVQVNIPARFSGLRRNERVGSIGGVEDVTGKCYFGTDLGLSRRDKIVFRGTTYNIRAFKKQMDRHGLRSFFTAFIGAEDEL